MVDTPKTAFAQGRLTADELDERVGQALAERTYAGLAALTADLPADQAPDRAPVPAPSPASARQRQNSAASRAVKAGAGAIGVTVIGASVAAAVVSGQPAARAARHWPGGITGPVTASNARNLRAGMLPGFRALLPGQSS